MGFLTIRSAAQALGRDERTLRRWIAAGTLPAHEAVNGRMLISADDVAALANRLAQEDTNQQKQAQPDTPDYAAQMEALRRELADLRDRVLRLELARATPTQPRQRPVAAAQEASDMPPELVIATVFCALHFPGLGREQIKRLTQTLRENGSVPMVPGTYKLGRAVANYALDDAGRQAFSAAASVRSGFQACPDCPHGEDTPN